MTKTLADRRKALGLSQSELASLLGVSQAAVSRCENEDRSDKRYALALEAIELRRAMERKGSKRTQVAA